MDSAYFDFADIIAGHDPFVVLPGMTASIAANIGILYECGARHLLFAYAPPLEASPIVPYDPTAPSPSAIYNYLFLQPVLDAYRSEPFNMNVSAVEFALEHLPVPD